MRLKDYLCSKDMTIKDFALQLKIGYVHIANVINGRIKPGPRLAKDIFEATQGNVTSQDLLDTYTKKQIAKNKKIETSRDAP